MSNTRKIIPFNTWIDNGNTEVNCLALTNFSGYNFDNGSGKVTYKLIFADEVNGATDLFSSEIDVPAEVVTQWGANDDVIFNYVAETLNITFL